MLNASEIVAALGGTNAAARFFGVSPPSVSEWVKKGEVPEDKLIKKAASLEQRLPDRFSRRSQWPNSFQEVWPELERRAAPRTGAVVAGEG
jgi:hypothetical protein